MKRTTISMPDDLAAAVEREAARRRIPVSQLAREALEARLGRSTSDRRELPFVAIGRSGHRTTARDIDAILDTDWAHDRDR
ncbi:MAG: ribbon-helix-helix protein, CopG family [Candidatus Limnocylindrales bacterium]